MARKGDYIKYQRLTAWRSAEPEGLSALQRAEFRFDRTLSRLGIDYLHVLFKLRRLPSILARMLDLLRQHLVRRCSKLQTWRNRGWLLPPG